MQMEKQIYTFDRIDENFTTVNWDRNRISETHLTTFRAHLTMWYKPSEIQARTYLYYYGYCNNDKYNILPSKTMRVQITQLLKNASSLHKTTLRAI